MAKLLLLQLLLAAGVKGSDVIFKPEGEEGFPRGCTGKACVYRVQWEFIKNRFGAYARFTVMARQKKDTYMAFGFSSEKNANKILAVYGYMTKSGERVVTGKILHGNTKPELSDRRGLLDRKLTYVDGVFTLVFDMVMETTDEDIPNLNNPYYYVFMVGGGPVLNVTELGPLGKNALHYTDKKISIVYEGDDFIFKPKGEEGIPHGCTGKACVYRVQWKSIKDRDTEYASFTVTARQKNDTYIAFGFSTEKNANYILAVYGFIVPKFGESAIFRGKILNGNTKPQLYAPDDLGYTNLTYEDGVFTLSFDLYTETKGKDSVKPYPYYYVLMVGGGPLLNGGEPGPLGNKALHYTDKKISLVDEITTFPPHPVETQAPQSSSDVIFKPGGEEGFPHGCTGKACVYRVQWEFLFESSGDFVRFTVTAMQIKDTYISFGFSTEKNANNILAVYGYLKKSGESVIVNGKIVHGNTKPQLSDRRGLWYAHLTYADSFFTLAFCIFMETIGGEVSVNLTNPYYYVLMAGGGPVLNDKELGPLRNKALQYSDKKISLVDKGGDVILKRVNEEGIPHGCTGKACLYRVKWECLLSGVREYERFTVMARQKNDTYIAFGFSTEKNANKILAVYGYMKKSGESVIVKGKILHWNTKPQLSDNDGLKYTGLTYVDGLFTLVFEIYLDRASEVSVNLMKPYYYVLMVGGGPVSNDNELGPLGKNALHYTDKKIILVKDDPCQDIKTGTKIVSPRPENCHEYFECYEHRSYTVTCEDELYFNTKTDSCTNEGDLTPERKKECGL